MNKKHLIKRKNKCFMEGDDTKKKQKVVIVEDDNFLGDLLLEHISKNGIEVSLFRDAETAFSSIEKEAPSLLLTDILLPGMDGFTFLEKLKEKKILPSLPVIILSNLSQTKDIEKGMTLGVKAYIGKSNFDLEDITKKVKEVLDQFK